MRLALHRRAPENLRRQFTRAALRVASLVVADLLVLVALRELHRLIGDVGWLLPRGYLTVWQDASALVLGLAVTGNYGPGDDHRDPARLFGGCALATALLLWSAPWSRSLVPVLLQCVPTVVVVWGAVVPSLRWSNIARELVVQGGLDPSTPAFSTVLACSTSMVMTQLP